MSDSEGKTVNTVIPIKYMMSGPGPFLSRVKPESPSTMPKAEGKLWRLILNHHLLTHETAKTHHNEILECPVSVAQMQDYRSADPRAASTSMTRKCKYLIIVTLNLLQNMNYVNGRGICSKCDSFFYILLYFTASIKKMLQRYVITVPHMKRKYFA